MRKIKYFLAIAAGLMIIGFSAPIALALEQPEYGGRSEDYHPPTGNPQGSSPAGLQPTGNSSVQPVPGGVNPQALPKTGDLRVLTSPDKGAPTTAPDSARSDKFGKYLITWVMGGALTFMLLTYILLKPDSKPYNTNDSVKETPTPPQVTTNTKPNKPKKNTKKKPSKKSKSNRR